MGPSNRTKDDISCDSKRSFFRKDVFSMLLCQGTLYQSTSSVVQVPFLVAQPCLPPTLPMMLSNALNHHHSHHAQAWTFPCSSLCLFCLFLFPGQITKAATSFNWIQLACSDTLVSLLALPFPGFLLKKFFPVLETVCALNTSSVNATSQPFLQGNILSSTMSAPIISQAHHTPNMPGTTTSIDARQRARQSLKQYLLPETNSTSSTIFH